MKVLLATVPKSGTHLMCEYLRSLGFSWSGSSCILHRKGIYGYREFLNYRGKDQKFVNSTIGKKPKLNYFKDIDEVISALNSDKAYKFYMDINEYAERVLDNNLIVGHYTKSSISTDILASNPSIFVSRNLRSGCLSMINFTRSKGEHNRKSQVIVEKYLKRAKGLRSWLTAEGTLQLKFEDLVGNPQEVLEKTANHLNLPHEHIDIKDILGRDNRTKTGKNVDLSVDWSPKLEKMFDNLGGNELNKVYGY